MSNFLRVGIIGAGLQAKRRIPAINSHPSTQAVAICSRTISKNHELVQKYSLPFFNDWQKVVNDQEIDIIVVATYPDSHAEISLAAIKAGKHVLCEKPLAKNLKEAQDLVKEAKRSRTILKCGFNHRFHPAILEAKNRVEQGKIGKLLYGRGIYGYCGRPGFEKEWRANSKYAAGGILMEQGIHLVDLFNWFFGNIGSVFATADSSYWQIPFEDNAFVIFKTKGRQTINFHTSMLQWKNTFLFEIYGTEGYLKVEGLGGSYGNEKLTYGKKDYTAPFSEEIIEYRGEDSSWKREWQGFLKAIDKKKNFVGSAQDGLLAMQLVEACYRSSREKKVITL